MKAPGKTGRESRMKEPYRKGVAIHLGPESCAGHGNMAGEALTDVFKGSGVFVLFLDNWS